MKRIVTASLCPKKAYFSDLRIKSSDKQKTKIKQAIIEGIIIGATGTQLATALHECIEIDSDIPMNKTRGIIIEKYQKKFDFLMRHLRVGGYIVERGETLTKTLSCGKTVKVKVDFYLLKDEDRIAITLFTGNEVPFSRSVKAKSFIGNNIDLYTMKEMLNMDCGFLCLTGKKDYSNSAILIDNELFEQEHLWTSLGLVFTPTVIDLYRKSLDEFLHLSNSSSKCIGFHCKSCPFEHMCKMENLKNEVAILEKPSQVRLMDFTSLSSEQMSVVENIDKRCLVSAGAGSGKTTTITARYINLMLLGIEPKDILMITFTEKGADEMRSKISQWLSQYNYHIEPEDLRIFTFNSFGFEIIKKYHSAFGFNKIPTLVNELVSIKEMTRILDELPQISYLNYEHPYMKLRYSLGAVHKMLRYVEMDKSGDFDRYVIDMREVITPDNFALIRQAIDLYKRFMIENCYVDYADQVNLVLSKVKSDENFRNLLINQYPYIFIDEFQDTSKEQLELIEIIGVNSSIMMVGDDSQAIFGFRGVGPKNFINYANKPEVSHLKMHTNYRSCIEVVKYANLLNSQMSEAKSKQMINPEGAEKGIVTKVISNGDKNQVINYILENHIFGDLSEVAILCRKRDDLMDFRNALNEVGIPNAIVVSEMYKDDAFVIACKGLIDFINDNENLLALASYLQIKNIEEFKEAFDLNTYINSKASEIIVDIATLNDNELYNYVLDSVKSAFNNYSIPMSEILELEETEAHSFERFSRYIKSIFYTNSVISSEASNVKYNGITLSTIHASKGKEWDNVIIWGELPKKIDNKEELKRLLYVATTRARKSLYFEANKEMFEFLERER